MNAAETPCDPLSAARDAGRGEGWPAFFVRGVAEAGLEATRAAADIPRMRENDRGKITDRLRREAWSGHRIVDRLFGRPVVEVATVRRWLRVARAGSYNLVRGSGRLGLLREIAGCALNQRVRLDPYLGPFVEPEEGRSRNGLHHTSPGAKSDPRRAR